MRWHFRCTSFLSCPAVDRRLSARCQFARWPILVLFRSSLFYILFFSTSTAPTPGAVRCARAALPRQTHRVSLSSSREKIERTRSRRARDEQRGTFSQNPTLHTSECAFLFRPVIAHTDAARVTPSARITLFSSLDKAGKK